MQRQKEYQITIYMVYITQSSHVLISCCMNVDLVSTNSGKLFETYM